MLDAEQRRLVEKTILDHCRIRGWECHAVNCRTNHLHVVVSADRHPEDVRRQLKAWCTRRLKELERKRSRGPVRGNWWAERGSRRYINNAESLEAAICYVEEGQEQR
ncbi:MAG: transposase [Planctomycetes bacterium]|nr:transposase [Planctomycetota bacterium]